MVTGSIVFGASVVFLLLILFTARDSDSLDDFVMNLPVIGGLYEAYFRPDTYHRQEQRLIYGDLIDTIVRAKVMEFCAAGGVENPEFRTVSNPEQIISEKELARLTGREEPGEGKRGGAGGSGREGGHDRHDRHGKSGKSG